MWWLVAPARTGLQMQSFFIELARVRGHVKELRAIVRA
jgi:hypothetical protein